VNCLVEYVFLKHGTGDDGNVNTRILAEIRLLFFSSGKGAFDDTACV
jgi:hypothetical protein